MDTSKLVIRFGVNVLNFDQVKDAIRITNEMINDDRIPVVVKEVYKKRIEAIEWESEDDE